MIADQDKAPGEQFLATRERVIAACDATVAILRSEPHGTLTTQDIERIKKAIDDFKERCWSDGADARHIASMLIDMITDQSHYTHGRKRKAFEALLCEAENLLVCFDPECSYDGPEGFHASRVFDALEI